MTGVEIELGWHRSGPVMLWVVADALPALQVQTDVGEVGDRSERTSPPAVWQGPAAGTGSRRRFRHEPQHGVRIVGVMHHDQLPGDSGTDVAVRLALDSWRWSGVPILIRAGKTMPVTATEVSIRFHRPPHDIFGVHDPAMTNALRFRIWPETRMTLDLAGKKPGAGRIPQLQALSFAEEPGSDMRPYDRLIGAALDGNRLPFAAKTP